MKTTTSLNSLSRGPLPFLAVLLVTVTLLAFAPQSACASGEKPFHANFITQVETVLEFPFLHVTVNSRGHATYMGRTTAFTDDQVVNLIDGSGTATYTLTGANDDTLVLALVVPVGGTINVDGESYSPGVTRLLEAPADLMALPAAAFLGERASFLLRPTVSVHLPSLAPSRRRAV